MKLFKKKKGMLRVTLTAASLERMFICLVTCFLSGAHRLGLPAMLFFFLFLYAYFAVLHRAWGLLLKLAGLFIDSAAEYGRERDDDEA